MLLIRFHRIRNVSLKGPRLFYRCGLPHLTRQRIVSACWTSSVKILVPPSCL